MCQNRVSVCSLWLLTPSPLSCTRRSAKISKLLMSTGVELADNALASRMDDLEIGSRTNKRLGDEDDGGGVKISCFSEVSEISDDLTFHFQIISLPNQKNTVSVTSLLAGASDNTGSGIARRIVIKTGLNVVLACNIPKDNPMLEINAEKMLVQKLIDLGYAKPKSKGVSL